jgi:hypothetical protein
LNAPEKFHLSRQNASRLANSWVWTAGVKTPAHTFVAVSKKCIVLSGENTNLGLAICRNGALRMGRLVLPDRHWPVTYQFRLEAINCLPVLPPEPARKSRKRHTPAMAHYMQRFR